MGGPSRHRLHRPGRERLDRLPWSPRATPGRRGRPPGRVGHGGLRRRRRARRPAGRARGLLRARDHDPRRQPVPRPHVPPGRRRALGPGPHPRGPVGRAHPRRLGGLQHQHPSAVRRLPRAHRAPRPARRPRLDQRGLPRRAPGRVERHRPPVDHPPHDGRHRRAGRGPAHPGGAGPERSGGGRHRPLRRAGGLRHRRRRHLPPPPLALRPRRHPRRHHPPRPRPRLERPRFVLVTRGRT